MSMMKISKVIPGASTILGEEKRKDVAGELSTPSLADAPKTLIGTIYKVHDQYPLVKVYDSVDGTVVANDKWIPLSHSPREVAERFGTIRVGMKTSVTCYGPNGLNAFAYIIMEENEEIGEEEFVENEMETGLWEIFKPGI